MTAKPPSVWWRPNGRSPFALDPTQPALPQIAAMVATVAFVVGGPALGLITIRYYPPLVMDETIYALGLGAIALGFLASFIVIPDRMMPAGVPWPQRLLARAGWGVCATFALLGVGGIANGWGTPVTPRDVPAVAKHETREHDPARRTHYVSIRAWPGSRKIVDLDAPADVYAQLPLPLTPIGAPQATLQAMSDAGTVRLFVGRGRLGLNWLSAVELPAPLPVDRR